jgi:hypothetical protein
MAWRRFLLGRKVCVWGGGLDGKKRWVQSADQQLTVKSTRGQCTEVAVVGRGLSPKFDTMQHKSLMLSAEMVLATRKCSGAKH